MRPAILPSLPQIRSGSWPAKGLSALIHVLGIDLGALGVDFPALNPKKRAQFKLIR